jgi:hypothetical protein
MKVLKQSNHLVTENPQYALNNVDNYKSNFDCLLQDILTKFVSVIVEYMRFMSEKISIKNKHYYRFIFERGIETLSHVFINTLYFTKNLDLSFYHSQKAYYFYIEFIEQISDENVTFLQLSSRDAILFVYKKTIYEINQEYKKTILDPSNEDTATLTTMDFYIAIYKNMIRYIFLDSEFNYTNNVEHIGQCCDKFKQLADEFNKVRNKKNHSECIYLFTNLLVDKQIKLSVFFNLILEFTKRLQSRKKIIDEHHLKMNMYSILQEIDIDTIDNNLIQDIFSE